MLPAVPAAIVLALSVYAVDTTVLEQKVTTRRMSEEGGGRESERTQRLSIAPGKARLEEQTGEVTVIRLDRGRLYEIDLLLASYFERDISNFRARWKKVNGILLKEISQMPGNHPMRYERIDALTDGLDKWELIWGLDAGPEKDKLLQKYHLPPDKPAFSVEKADKTKNIEGHKCVLYKILEDGKMRAFAWVTQDIQLDRDLIEFLKVTGIVPEEVARELLKIKGFPLEYAVYWRDGHIEHTESLKVEKKNLAEGKFEVPEGFVKQERR
jgi:hypothetical protein